MGRVDDHSGCRMIGVDACSGDELEEGPIFIEQVSESAGHVFLVGKTGFDGGKHVLL